MRVLVACEFSGVVREAFRKLGHDAWSCDLLPTEIPGQHIQGDVLDILGDGWDLMISHPPYTYLTCAQNKWYLPRYRDRFPDRLERQRDGAEFFLRFTETGFPKACIENPIGRMSTLYRKPDQIIQPWQFGHDARKATCLWLTGLPKLTPTNIVPVTIHRTKSGKTMSEWHVRCGHAKNKPERAKLRSITFQGIADAMASQWGNNASHSG